MEKIEIVFFVNRIYSLITIFGLFIGFILLLTIIFKKQINLKLKNIFLFPILVSFLATIGSLFYSEYAGYEPCKLCWFQRIFMYPQFIIFIVAYFLKDKKVFYYSLILSIVGGVTAFSHYLLQFGFLKTESCGVVGYSVSCVKKFVAEFGFVTIPLMATVAFLLLILYSLLILKNQDRKKIVKN